MPPTETSVESSDTKEESSLVFQPFNFFTPMDLRKGTSVHIATKARVEIRIPSPFGCTYQSIFIFSPAGIQISTNCNVELLSDDALGSRFAQLWSKLPEELKVCILECNLTFEKVSKPILNDDKEWLPANMTTQTLRQLSHHLRTTPEIAALSKHVYYKVNTFHLHFGTFQDHFAYPKPTVNQFIRYLHLKIEPHQLARYWKHLQGLAGGRYGFQNVQHVKVEIWWEYCDSYDFVKLEAIKFHCKGEISSTTSTSKGLLHTADVQLMEQVQDSLQDLIRFEMRARD